MLSSPWTTILLLAGVASFLSVLAIVLRARIRKPKKAEKWEKAQIMKQLLALSESENMLQGNMVQRTPRPQSVPKIPLPRRQAAAAGASQSRTARPA